MTVRTASIQFAPVFGRKAENLRALARLVIEAASKGAKLIVLPELAVTGYSFMSKEAAAAVAEPISAHRDNTGTDSVSVMTALSRKYGVAIAWGLVEIEKGTGNLYNSQVLLAPNGDTVHYSKINPWGQDYIWATPGRANPPILNIDFGAETRKVGLLICRDIRDKKDDKWSSFYERGDADIVCFSSNWGRGGFPAVAWMDFVADNGCALVVSNRYGTEVNNDFGGGGSCIISRKGEINCEGLIWGESCIIYGDL